MWDRYITWGWNPHSTTHLDLSSLSKRRISEKWPRKAINLFLIMAIFGVTPEMTCKWIREHANKWIDVKNSKFKDRSALFEIGSKCYLFHSSLARQSSGQWKSYAQLRRKRYVLFTRQLSHTHIWSTLLQSSPSTSSFEFVLRVLIHDAIDCRLIHLNVKGVLHCKCVSCEHINPDWSNLNEWMNKRHQTKLWKEQ